MIDYEVKRESEQDGHETAFYRFPVPVASQRRRGRGIAHSVWGIFVSYQPEIRYVSGRGKPHPETIAFATDLKGRVIDWGSELCRFRENALDNGVAFEAACRALGVA